MRLVDADVAMCWMEQNEAFIDSQILRAIPTVDAIPIIRCKDCAYFHPYPFEPSYGSCKYHLGPDLQWEEKKEMDYCSDAEEIKDVD